MMGGTTPMYERRGKPLISRAAFAVRLGWHWGAALVLLIISLAIGVFGFRLLEHLGGFDSLLMASMLLSGMGPTAEIHSNAAKLFASFYAIYCGAVFLIVLGVVLAPVVHRLLHSFHVDDDDE